MGSLRDREVACSASDRQGSNFESCVWRTVPSQSSHHPQGVLLAQFSLYVHKGGLKPDSFHFIFVKPVLTCFVNTAVGVLLLHSVSVGISRPCQHRMGVILLLTAQEFLHNSMTDSDVRNAFMNVCML